MPPTLDFLFSRNRLNVAVSRPMCLACIVASPRLLESRARTIEQMRLINGHLDPSPPLPLCWIATHVEDRKDYDDVGFDREVHRIGKATEESAPDPRLEVAILERILDDSIVRAAQLLQKL